MYKLFNLLFLLIFIASCSENRNKQCFKLENFKHPIENDTIIQHLQEEILLRGDTNAYIKLSQELTLKMRYDEMLFYSLFMSNKFNYPIASYDVYFLLSDNFSPSNLKSNDSVTKALSYAYLIKSLTDSNANSYFASQKIFGRKNPKIDSFLNMFVNYQIMQNNMNK